MDSQGANEDGQMEYNYIKENRYITVFIVGVGAFYGYLYAAPVRQDYAECRFFIQVTENMRFFADLLPLQIRDNEHLTEDRYFIEINKPYLVTGWFGDQPIRTSAHVKLRMRESRRNFFRRTLYGGIGYQFVAPPAWASKNYIQPRDEAEGSNRSRRSSGK